MIEAHILTTASRLTPRATMSVQPRRVNSAQPSAARLEPGKGSGVPLNWILIWAELPDHGLTCCGRKAKAGFGALQNRGLDQLQNRPVAGLRIDRLFELPADRHAGDHVKPLPEGLAGIAPFNVGFTGSEHDDAEVVVRRPPIGKKLEIG